MGTIHAGSKRRGAKRRAQSKHLLDEMMDVSIRAVCAKCAVPRLHSERAKSLYAECMLCVGRKAMEPMRNLRALG